MNGRGLLTIMEMSDSVRKRLVVPAQAHALAHAPASFDLRHWILACGDDGEFVMHLRNPH